MLHFCEGGVWSKVTSLTEKYCCDCLFFQGGGGLFFRFYWPCQSKERLFSSDCCTVVNFFHFNKIFCFENFSVWQFHLKWSFIIRLRIFTQLSQNDRFIPKHERPGINKQGLSEIWEENSIIRDANRLQ